METSIIITKVCSVLQFMMYRTLRTAQPADDNRFDEFSDPLVLPDVGAMYRYVCHVFRYLPELEPSMIVQAFALLVRFLRESKMTLHSNNWRLMFIVALNAAQKGALDTSYGNSHFAQVCGIDLTRFHELELAFLSQIGFDVILSKEEYDSCDHRIHMMTRRITA